MLRRRLTVVVVAHLRQISTGMATAFGAAAAASDLGARFASQSAVCSIPPRTAKVCNAWTRTDENLRTAHSISHTRTHQSERFAGVQSPIQLGPRAEHPRELRREGRVVLPWDEEPCTSASTAVVVGGHGTNEQQHGETKWRSDQYIGRDTFWLESTGPTGLEPAVREGA